MKKILINGDWRDSRSDQRRMIVNPATLEPLDEVPDCGKEDVDAAVKAARGAQKQWWKVPGVEKAGLLREIAARVRKKEHALSTLMTLETGKPLIEGIDCIDWVAACFDYYAEVARSSRGLSLPPVAPHQVAFTIKEPYGVVAAIAPFNFPLLLLAWKVAPAIAAGNTIVCKPPHQNPLSNLLMGEVYDLLPPGVVNIVTGDGACGELLVSHPGVDLIAFTGSCDVGRRIAAVAGAQLKKTVLELGGVDPFIVCEDANLDVAVPGAAWARLLNAGQVCTSAKRIYVVEQVYDTFVSRLVEQVKTVKAGNPMKPDTDVGPLISLEALKKVERQVAGIREEGARLLLGGEALKPEGMPGHFFAPTVFVDVKHGGRATQEEVFGPVLCVFRAKNVDEAIAMADDSQYGLGATIYTRSLEYAMRAMENIKAGTFWINDPLTDNEAGPFGGMRCSGIGRELGEEGLDAFRETKHVHIDYVMERKYFWFPYAARPIPSEH